MSNSTADETVSLTCYHACVAVRDKLYEKFKQFRDKYNQLVRGKAEVQAALIHSEVGPCVSVAVSPSVH